MEHRQVAALAEMVDAVNAGDAKRYARVYAPDSVITIYGSGNLRGRDAIEQHEVELLRQFPGTRLAFSTISLTGSSAVVHYAVNGPAAGGRPMGHEGLLFYRFEPSGLIAEERRYLDSLTPMAQMGLLGALPVRPLPMLSTEPKVNMAKGSPHENANSELVRAALAALDAKNEPAFLSSLADDAVLDELILPQPFLGKGNVRTWYGTWTRAVPDARTEISTILAIGEFVLLESVVRGSLRGPLGPLSASGKEFAAHRALFVEVKNGKLVRISAFMNAKEIAEAVGQWPPRAEK